MEKILIAGPFVGEFGWEVFWQGCVRQYSKSFDKTIVITFPDRFPLYDDFATCYAHDFKGHSDCFSMQGVSRADLSNFVKDHFITQNDERFEYHFLDPMHHLTTPRYNSINNFVSVKDFGHWIVPEGEPNTKYDILIHARNRNYVPQSNWPKENWIELIEYLKSKGYKVASFGTDAFNFMGCDKLNNINMVELFKYLKGCKLVIGPSSGGMHLAQLCKAPVLTWGWGMQGHHGKLRYLTNWNFHNTEAFFLGDYNFQPPVEKIKEIFNERFDYLSR